MPTLILVKHSLPQIDPLRPANQWLLSNEGRRRCRLLAQRLAIYHPDVVVASVEPKAEETARLVAASLDRPIETMLDLHEHDRSNVAFMDLLEFKAAVADFFAHPDHLVFGAETAVQAQRRFTQAVSKVVERHPDQNIIIVTHGAVISLFVGQHTGSDPFALWPRLGLPSFVVLAAPTMAVMEIVETIAESPR